MKNKNIKNVLFYIVLLPYVILLFMCIYYATIGYGYNLGNTAYGFVAVGQFLGDVFDNIINMFFNPITLCIIILWISYQIYYFISFKVIKKILFFTSILCWIIYFASGIFAFFFGSNTGGDNMK